MTGKGKYLYQVPTEHRCEPPNPYQNIFFNKETQKLALSPGERHIRIGDVWECGECAKVWIFRAGKDALAKQGIVVANAHTPPKWDPETRFEAWRRKRKTKKKKDNAS